MGKKFARKIATLLLSFAMVFSCLFVFSACKDKEDPADEVKVTSISVALVDNSPYTLEENVLNAYYNGEKIEFTSSDFVVTAHKSNNTTAVLSQKTNTVDGYTLTSTVPDEGVTELGEYKLTFSYTGVSNVEIQVIVNKGNIDVSGVTLTTLTYNGTEQTLQIADILNLPENVTAEFVSGNSGTTAQNYDAVVRFTYTGADAESYNAIPDTTITWKMQKANYNVSNISWVRGENDVYTGLPQTVEIEIDGELPEGVTLKGYLNNEFTNAGSYTAKVQFNFDSLNYNKPAVDDFAWVIKKAPLTVKANNATIIFGEAAINTGVSYSGFVNGETKDVLGGELSYEYGAYYVGSDVDTYDILPSGLSSTNYQISYVTGDLVVNKATYSYDDIDWVYDGPYTYNSNIQKPTVTGAPELVGYSIVATKASVEDESVNAGTYVAAFTVTSFKNYDFEGELPTIDYVINKAALSIKALNHKITYGDEPSNAGVLAEGFKGIDDNLDIFNGQEFIYEYNYIAGDDAGSYTITVSGVTAENYEITFHAGVLTVEAIILQYSSVNFEYSEPFTYDGLEKALTVSGVPDYVSYTIAYTKGGVAVAPKNAGRYVASIVVQENKNYTYMGQVATQEFVIQKVALTITANNKTITYGDEPTHAGVEYSGFVNDEDERVLGGEILYTYGEYVAGADIGESDIEISGITSENYEISYVKGVLNVEPLEVNVSAYTWNYTTLTYTGTLQEPKLNEISQYISANYSYTQNDAPAYAINAGSYVASVTFNTSDNYEIVGTVSNLSFSIKKAELVVTANSHTISYLDEAANNGVSYSGFVNNETESVLVGELVYDYTYSSGNDVGEYLIYVSGLSSNNYEIEFNSGTLTVEALVVKLTDFVWDYETAYTYTGVSQKPILSTYPEFLTTPEYIYEKDSVEDNSIDAGSYKAMAIFDISENYEIEGDIELNYVISKVELIVTAKDHTIKYLDEPSNDGVVYTGFVNNEDYTILDGSLVYDYGDYEKGSNTGSNYRITVSGLSADNYEISYRAGVLTVEAIFLEYNNYQFNYNGTEEFVYNGTAVQYEVSGIPEYVIYNIVYKLNDETVVDAAINAGSYTVTFVPQTSTNYIFTGSALKQAFTINKATIDETKLYFVLDGSKDGISVKEKYENQPTEMAIYESIFYYDGVNHTLEFINNTGVAGVTFRYTVPDDMRTQIKNVGGYNIAVDIVVSNDVLNNYEALECTQYFIEIQILEILSGFKVIQMEQKF